MGFTAEEEMFENHVFSIIPSKGFREIMQTVTVPHSPIEEAIGTRLRSRAQASS
jgi:hypothetical protein